MRRVILGILAGFAVASAQGAGRASDGLQVLYNFSSPGGAIVKDRSGAGEPLDLRITDTNAVRQSKGSLEVRGHTLIRSDKPASKIIDGVRQSGEITLEAWIRPAGTNQSGPARIVTLSKDPNERDFTLGQDGDRFDVRFRTTQTGANGIPSLGSAPGSLTAGLTHVVYTRDRAGQARIFINGRKMVEQPVAGDPSNWDGSFRLALANELTGDRPWLGTFHLVAIYSRKLASKEVEQNFNAGIGAPPAAAVAQTKAVQEPKTAAPPKTAPPASDRAQHFDAQIASLLGRHCVECHGPTKPKGRLDLSRKEAAFAGGKNGPAIVPGKAAESLLWKKVESDEMPEERPPLSRQEKRLLREWIDSGAIWSANATAPLTHLPQRGADASLLRRLTVPEYIETVRSAVGVDVAKDAREILPRDLRADGFNNTAYNLNVDLEHVEAYARLARIIVGRMDVLAFAAEHTKCQKLDDACMREVISRMGKWLLRGPLEEREIGAFLRVSKAVAGEGGNFKQAVGLILEAMLQSPRFIYRIEPASSDGKPRPVRGYELASRLSYILWGAPPDRELMRAAEAGELSDRRRVEGQVRRMVQDLRAVERSVRFIHEWLNLDRLENLRPDKERFAAWDRPLAGDMRDETLAFFKEIAWEQKRPLSDLLNSRVTYATPRLAKFYGLPQKPASAIRWRAPERGAEGLEALYTFAEGSGDTLRDVSGAGEPIHLKIEDPSAVQWSAERLIVNASTLMASSGPARRLAEAVRKTKNLTLEVWITPADASQSGPARILTLSSGTGLRNFMLGQNGDKYEVRFRAAGTDANGLPGLSSPGGSVQTRPTHVVFTRNGAGKTKLYLNGDEKAAGEAVGDLSNWEDGFQLALANETTKDRPWRGALHLVAIYSRVLSPEEVRSNGQVLARYDLASVPGRGGLLTQGSALTVGGDQASMVARGLFILQDFLAGKVEDPPPCVDTTPVPAKPGLSRRAVAEARLANQACAGCHSKFEPLAFALERFDGLGAYHEKDEHGNPLRGDGEILFPDNDKPVAFRSAEELMDLLAGSKRVHKVLTQKVTQFALGRPLMAKDAPIVDKIHAQAQKDGGTYASLITAIVMSDLVQQ
ncbi:MAG TPA: LamG-like jellyroll fold domain-containing protein [Verrucomicrobiae bacterium]|nr:LamG-like jellyroll fold domain-containing protein [Verrucomicrobiae bacterium]